MLYLRILRNPILRWSEIRSKDCEDHYAYSDCANHTKYADIKVHEIIFTRVLCSGTNQDQSMARRDECAGTFASWIFSRHFRDSRLRADDLRWNLWALVGCYTVLRLLWSDDACFMFVLWVCLGLSSARVFPLTVSTCSETDPTKGQRIELLGMCTWTWDENDRMRAARNR